MQSLENTMLITDLDGTLLPASKEWQIRNCNWKNAAGGSTIFEKAAA